MKSRVYQNLPRDVSHKDRPVQGPAVVSSGSQGLSLVYVSSHEKHGHQIQESRPCHHACVRMLWMICVG